MTRAGATPAVHLGNCVNSLGVVVGGSGVGNMRGTSYQSILVDLYKRTTVYAN